MHRYLHHHCHLSKFEAFHGVAPGNHPGEPGMTRSFMRLSTTTARDNTPTMQQIKDPLGTARDSKIGRVPRITRYRNRRNHAAGDGYICAKGIYLPIP